MQVETKAQISVKRKEIEQELLELLTQAKSDFTLEHIKEGIYNEKEQNDLAKLVRFLDTGQDDIELQNILDVLIEAWNYFPHKALGGLSPAEKALEYQNLKK